LAELRAALAAPGTRAFLMMWTGLTVSLLGSALTAFALGIRIFQQTDSTTQYALVLLSAAVPPLVVLPLAGPLVDRFHRKLVLVGCDALGAAATCGIAGLAWSGNLGLGPACALVAVLSAVGAVQWPAYSATVTLLVPREQLGRANGLTQIAHAVSQVAAPLVAGGLIVWIGLAGIAAVDLATFAFSTVLLLLAAIPRGSGTSAAPRRGYLRDLPFGWRYIRDRRGLLALLVMFALINFFAEMASVLFTPLVLAFSTPAALGAIVSVGGLGLVAGGVLLTAWGGPRRPALGAAAFGAGALAAPAVLGALIDGLIGPLAPPIPDEPAKAREAAQGLTLLALRALGVVDAHARGLVMQCVWPAHEEDAA